MTRSVSVVDLGDRVLDLQAGVDLEEGEEPLARVVEELDGAGAGVPDRDGEPLGRLALSSAACVGVEHRRGRLLDDLLVAALHRAVAHPDRPRRALAVGDDLHLDVPGAGDEPLEEDHARAEGALRLVAGALVGVGEVGVGGDHADAAAAAAGGRLEHERVADLRRPRRWRPRGCRRRPRLHGATGTPTSSAMSLEPILSPSRRIASGLGPMKVTPMRSHSSAKAGSSATKPQPTHAASAPVSTQRPLEHRVVEVGPLATPGPGRRRRPPRGRTSPRARASVCSATVSMRCPPGPACALRSRTAWMSRIAASPRLTMAMRRNIDHAFRVNAGRQRSALPQVMARACHGFWVTRE